MIEMLYERGRGVDLRHGGNLEGDGYSVEVSAIDFGESAFAQKCLKRFINVYEMINSNK